MMLQLLCKPPAHAFVRISCCVGDYNLPTLIALQTSYIAVLKDTCCQENKLCNMANRALQDVDPDDLREQACEPADTRQQFTVSRRDRVLNLRPKLFPQECLQRQPDGAPHLKTRSSC